MPLELKHQFRTLLPYVAINPAVRNLFYTSRQPDGTLIYHGPVQNRPWEWTEYLGDDNPDEFKNSGSLSLELFDAKLTGDHLLDSKGLSERAGSSLLSLRNDVVYENIFERDWREGRVPLQAGTPPECGSRLGGNDEEDEDFDDILDDKEDLHEIQVDDDMGEPDPEDDDHLPDDDLQ